MSVTTVHGSDPRDGSAVDLGIENGCIVSISPSPLPSDYMLSAGFIDLQVNGFAGFDLNEATLATSTVIAVTNAMLAEGVTSFVPTLITASEAHLCASLRVIADARRLDERTRAAIPFIHVEGPHISPLDGFRGAHPSAHVRPPSIAEFERWQAACEGIVGIVTLSPHWDDTSRYIQHLTQHRVHVAIGHTHASADAILCAVEAGATLSTHLGNAVAQQIARHDNPLWPQLADDRLTATFIADGHHLPSPVLRAMMRAKGLSRCILVSDCVALAGMPAGTYASAVGGRVKLRADGQLSLAGTEFLAGSTASLRECIGRAVSLAQLPLADALQIATEQPARFTRASGRLQPGMPADIVRFRWQNTIVVEDVWLRGTKVFSRAQ